VVAVGGDVDGDWERERRGPVQAEGGTDSKKRSRIAQEEGDGFGRVNGRGSGVQTIVVGLWDVIEAVDWEVWEEI